MKMFLVILFLFSLVAIPVSLQIRKSALTPIPSSDTGKPEIPLTDLAPGVSFVDKIHLLVKHADSTMTEFLLPKTMVQSYIQSLPKGDVVVRQQ